MAESALEKGFQEILSKKKKYGCVKPKKEKIQVEFISANPTGPLTLANGRGGFFGDTLARVLTHQGYQVEREYYINDSGNQIRTLGHAMRAAAGLEPFAEGYYTGLHIDAWAKKNRAFLKKTTDSEAIGRRAAADFLKNFVKPAVVKKMGIRFDKWTSEHAVARAYLKKLQTELERRELLYKKDGAVYLKTSEFGDEKDRVVITSDGYPTYFFNDGAHYLETRLRKFDQKINILGADHHGYVGRIQAMAHIVGIKKSEVLIAQLVRLVSGGEEVRMSKRRGVFVTIDELIDDVGQDAARYFFLERSLDTHMDFDLDLAKERSVKNPVYYVQYAHARIAQIFAKKEAGAYRKGALALLNSMEERALVKKLLQFPEALEDAAQSYHVHYLPRYAYDLARAFHLFYETHLVIGKDVKMTEARLLLVRATQIVLQNTLGLLGISAPKKM